MTVISQDDHLTAGAWAACVLTSLSPIAAVTCFPRSALDSIYQNHLGREGLRWNDGQLITSYTK